MRKLFYYLFIILNIQALSLSLYAQDSLISIILKTKESIVSVKGIQTGIIKNPKASAAYDPNSGKILIARQAKAAYYEQNGAGIILSPDGYIVTNLHVIRGAANILIELFDSSKYSARVERVFPDHDLALLKIDTSMILNPIEFADSNKINLGNQIINIGNSSFLKETISEGKITAIGRAKLSQEVEAIRVNLNLYKGDSGGPLLDAEGKLIGIISAKAKSKERATYAIPSNKIKNLCLDFIK